MALDGICDLCSRQTGNLFLAGEMWLCKGCYHCPPPVDVSLPFEMGHANPEDPEGTTAHVRDIQDRRWHPTEKRMFRYSKEKPKTYFFPKG